VVLAAENSRTQHQKTVITAPAETLQQQHRDSNNTRKTTIRKTQKNLREMQYLYKYFTFK
jgi:hypothetical protein